MFPIRQAGLVDSAPRDPDGRLALDEDRDEELICMQPNIDVFLGSSRTSNHGRGTLYVTTRRVAWLSDSDASVGHQIDWRSLTLHAISRDLNAFPFPCLYCQVTDPNAPEPEGPSYLESHGADEDASSDDAGSGTEAEAEAEADSSPSSTTDLRYVPTDPSQLERIFRAFCDCAAINPDSEEEGEGDFFYNADEVAAGAALYSRIDNNGVSLPSPAQFDAMVQDSSRFEDAEGEEEGPATNGHPPMDSS
mmetsp:Transcript_14234/g.24342  ORF Transcript_14234/g.24342 Transcript_14234/m.24342 type:complete len:249 (-) Transcript_14234:71-817(-)